MKIHPPKPLPPCLLFAPFSCIKCLTMFSTISPSPHSKPSLLSSRLERSKHTAWMLPCWALIGDQDVCGKEAEHRLAHFYSLITFTGPQSHLCNHGDADKVTHDYSSMALPDWTAPESHVKRIHQHSLCPCSTSKCLSG